LRHSKKGGNPRPKTGEERREGKGALGEKEKKRDCIMAAGKGAFGKRCMPGWVSGLGPRGGEKRGGTKGEGGRKRCALEIVKKGVGGEGWLGVPET